MKARPRSVERRVAELLNEYLFPGLTPVKRIPVPGTTGPDIQINEFGLAIDVKSRISIPKAYFLEKRQVGRYGDTVAVRLCDIREWLEETVVWEGGWWLPEEYQEITARRSVTVSGWLDHMNSWCNGRYIPALVLHYPGTHVKHSTFLMCIQNLGDMYAKFKQFKRHSNAPIVERNTGNELAQVV